MLKYEDILNQVNNVIEYSQNTPADSRNLLIEWAKAKEELSNRYLDGKLIKNFGYIEMKLSPEECDKQFDEFIGMFRYDRKYLDFVQFLDLNKKSFFDNKVTTPYEIGNNKINVGMKLSKAFKFFIEDKEELDKYQTMASRLIQNNVLSGELCGSIHPLDFLSSSENAYNWRSCHALDGEYRSGNLSYMVDSTTMMFYIKGEKDCKLPNFPESIPWNSKKWRMLMFISEGREVFFAGRQYPFDLGTNILEKILEVLNLSTYNTNSWFATRPWSYWHKDRIESIDYEENKDDNSYLKHTYLPIHYNLYNINEIIKDEAGSKHFNDLLNSSCYKPYYSWSRDTRHKPMVKIGGEIPCPCCGNKYKKVEYTDRMMCYDCYDTYGQEDDDHYRCHDCGVLHHIDDMYWCETGEYYVCASCYDNNYAPCDCCGEIYHIDELIEENGNYYCENCAGDE